MDRIQRDGYSEVLCECINRWRVEELSTDIVYSSDVLANYALLRCFDYRWLYEGVVERMASVVIDLSFGKVIEVDVQSRRLLRVNGEDVVGIEHARVLDLSDDGERWEGDVLLKEPYGWGVAYDSENRKTYEGFRIGEVSVCYGRSYYSDIQKVEYEGMICEGKRWGKGVHYDRNGDIVFEGEWMNDSYQIGRRIEKRNSYPLLHCLIEEFIVSNGCCNGPIWEGIDFSFIPHLRQFYVGDYCFESVNEVKLIGLNELERVVIGNDCFTKQKNNYGIDLNQHFYVKNCEQLREMRIGCWSFCDYSVCEIENVNRLEVIEIGDYCFENVKEVELIGLIELKKVVIGKKCFTKHTNGLSSVRDSHFYLKDCERLREMKIGWYSFLDYSSCEIENVDSLEVIEMGEMYEESGNFRFASLELKSVVVEIQ